MKHILNDLTDQEKNAIREQHTGGMKVMTEKFSKLTNSKLGDVKLISEQPLPYKSGVDAAAKSLSKPIVGMLPQIKACVAQGGYPKLTEFLKKQENKQLDNIVIDMLMTFSVKKDPQASNEIGKLIECLQKSSKSGSSMQNEQVKPGNAMGKGSGTMTGTNQNAWAKYPCVAKLKDATSPKGEKSKVGEGVFKDLLFYPNGRCMDVRNKSMAFYKCHTGGVIVVSDDPNIDLNTIDTKTENPTY